MTFSLLYNSSDLFSVVVLRRCECLQYVFKYWRAIHHVTATQPAIFSLIFSSFKFFWHFLLQFFQILLPISYQARILSRDYTHREQSLEACIRQEGPPCSGLSTSSPAPSAPNACGIPFALRSLRFTDKEFLAIDESPLMFLIMHHGCLVMSLRAHADAHLTGSQRNLCLQLSVLRKRTHSTWLKYARRPDSNDNGM